MMHTRVMAGLAGLALTLAASALAPKIAAAQEAPARTIPFSGPEHPYRHPGESRDPWMR